MNPRRPGWSASVGNDSAEIVAWVAKGHDENAILEAEVYRLNGASREASRRAGYVMWEDCFDAGAAVLTETREGIAESLAVGRGERLQLLLGGYVASEQRHERHARRGCGLAHAA